MTAAAKARLCALLLTAALAAGLSACNRRHAASGPAGTMARPGRCIHAQPARVPLACTHPSDSAAAPG